VRPAKGHYTLSAIPQHLPIEFECYIIEIHSEVFDLGLSLKVFGKSLEVWQKFNLSFIARGLELGVGNPISHR